MPLADALTLTHSLLVGAGLRDPIDRANSRVALLASGKVRHLTLAPPYLAPLTLAPCLWQGTHATPAPLANSY